MVCIPLSRLKALTKAALWAAAALIPGVFAWLIYDRVNHPPSAVSGRLVDYSIALVGLPVAASALVCTLAAVRWLTLGLWPGSVNICADDDGLTLRLGPFGSRRYDAAGMTVRYPFELAADVEDAGFEAFLPQEEQVARLLPCIEHPRAPEPLNFVLRRYAAGSESELAAALARVLDRWRERDRGET